ncbi:TonB-dependent receptor domain-containing protein, partial [Pseudoalteromonas phenolica]|uniref:TonB-dependent receptor domain-containing protein n=1 Tax=Pseudoalteromonas phenolica TaxID=161398 RepID=UPI00110B8BEF
DRVYRSINDNCVGVTVKGAPGSYTVEGNDVTAPCINYMGADSLSQEDADYIRYTDQAVGYNQMSLTALSISGELFELPGGYAGFAAGYEHREEEGGSSPDALTVSGVGSGNASSPTFGSFQVDEIYAELYLPVIDDLEITAAIRAFDYSTFGQDETWKLGFKYAPIDGLTLRGTISTAFRAPSIGDLFGGQSTGYPPYTDPCNNWDSKDSNSNIYKNCSRDVGAGFEQPNGQVDRSLSGGNPDLQPETADTLTYGFIYEPSFVEGFSMTVDYFNIEMENVITSVGAQTIIDKCYEAADGGIGGASSWCSTLSRNAIGTVSGVEATSQNLSVWEVEGVDFNFNYTTDLSNLTLKVDWEGTHYMSWKDQSFEGQPIDENVGRATTGTIADWKHTLSTSLRADDWSVTWVARYISESETSSIFDAKQDLAQGIANGVTGDALTALKQEVDQQKLDAADHTAEAYITHNVSVSYYVNDNFSVSAGIRNLTDETPPYFTDYGDSNTDQYTYDTVGRRWFMSFSSKF